MIKSILNRIPLFLNKVTFILFLFFIILVSTKIGVAETTIDTSNSFQDSVNFRKSFFLKATEWDSFVDTKRVDFYNKDIGLIITKLPPKYLSDVMFEDNILKKNNSKLIKNSYFLNDKNFYELRDDIDLKTKIEIKTMLEKDGFTNFDYYMIFYQIDPLFKNSNNILTETHSYGRITYLFNYKKEMMEVKVYFHKNSNSYLYFNSKNPTKFDVYLFDRVFQRDLFYYFPFESLKFLSIESIISLLYDNRIEKQTIIDFDDSILKEDLINKIIAPITDKNYPYVDDGGRDRLGNFVYINNGEMQQGINVGFNCSGFVKEVFDNYIRLKDKKFQWMDINELKKSRDFERIISNYTKYYELYDSFFGLDWSKNIIDKINDYYEYKYIKARPVDNDKFALYNPIRGYKFSELRDIIFRDQKDDNNYFYILVFSELRQGAPVIPLFSHIAITVPYFKDKHFNMRVFESGTETSYSSLSRIRKNSEVYIIKVPLPIAEIYL